MSILLRNSRIGSIFEPTPGQRLAGKFAIPAIVAAAVFTIGGLLGLPVFPSNVNNARKSEVLGCYFIGNDLAAKVDHDRITSGGISSPYDVISDSRGLAILPTTLLQAKLSGSTWRIVNPEGNALLLPLEAGDRPTLSFLTEQGQEVRAYKGPCR